MQRPAFLADPGFTPGLAAFLAALACPAFAIGLGDLQVHSSLGEPLDASVAVTTSPGESVSAECFYIGRSPAGGVPTVTRATFAVETAGGSTRVRVRTIAPVSEPALILRLNAACDGAGAVTREFGVLLDPRPAAIPAGGTPAPAQSLAPAGGTSAPSARGVRSLPGDSIASIAAAIYPRNRAAREAYALALRERNPPLSQLRPEDPIPPGTAIEFPDLQAVAMGLRPGSEAGPGQRAASARRAKAAPAEAAPANPAPRQSSRKARRESAPGAPARSARRGAGGDFVLRLSGSDIDLSRSRDVDERTRAQLRERLLLLDADDQVSALLSMRNSLKQLEGRVSELQLKLSGLGAGPLPGAAAVTQAPAAPVTTVPQPTTPAPPPEGPAAAKPVEPAAAGTPPSPDAEPKTVAAPAQPPAVPAAKEKGTGFSVSSVPLWAWGAFAIALLAIAMFGLRRAARQRDPARDYAVLSEPAFAKRGSDTAPAKQAVEADEGPPTVTDTEERRVAETDADLATRVPGTDPLALRRRYIEERFPEITSGAISLDNPDSVVKGARLFYEDGAIPRAVELLQFAVEEKPKETKPWLALFEIFRLEGLAGEFAVLAARFSEHHGGSENWKKVQYIGRELDPGNPLYEDAALKSLESIGYPSAKKTPAVTFDPVAENWLNVPMDFTSDALAAELRGGLLSGAGITESDLIPNPMPALKSVEVFKVA